MNDIKTNRDFYLAISQLIKSNEHSRRSLEDYLLAILGLGSAFQNRETLFIAELFDILAKGFTAEPIEFEPIWKEFFLDNQKVRDGFKGWEATIKNQIIDLHEMGEADMFNNEFLYFGIDSPRGIRWFNFDPCNFLECATAGAYGGWQDGDDTGRSYVHGPVAVLNEDGTIGSQDPRGIEDPLIQIDEVSWEDFGEFLLTGQYYE